MTAQTARSKRHERNRQSILAAARQIVAQGGAESLSIRELARQIDYSPAGIYEYFDGKEQIIQALRSEGHQQLSSAMRTVDTSLPPLDYLREIGLAYIQFALRNPDLYLLMFTNFPNGIDLETMQSATSSFPILTGAVQRGIAAGDFHPRPNFGQLEMAYAAWAIVHGIAMLRLTYLGDFPVDLSLADEESLRALGRGLQGC